MRSRANFKTHPIHPMLIGFPLSFFTGAFVFDLLFLVTKNVSLQITGYYLVIAGIVGAVLAAVPGFIDYLNTVPPKSSAKERAAKHGLINTSNLVLFIVIFFLKKDTTLSPIWIVLMEAVGVVLLVIAGWMGGTLVYRNQIGVDIRYADAGKWNEVYLQAESDEVEVAKSDELQVNQMKLVHLDGKRIVIARSDDGYVAFNDHCTHKGGSLVGGSMICGTVQCPWHGSQFDVHNGRVKEGPAKTSIQTYPLEERNGAVYLRKNNIN
jgi:uncharacterized membrane protein/nitrite reductase/ring-hydroxylating ferredoxin subunit